MDHALEHWLVWLWLRAGGTACCVVGLPVWWLPPLFRPWARPRASALGPRALCALEGCCPLSVAEGVFHGAPHGPAAKQTAWSAAVSTSVSPLKGPPCLWVYVWWGHAARRGLEQVCTPLCLSWGSHPAALQGLAGRGAHLHAFSGSFQACRGFTYQPLPALLSFSTSSRIHASWHVSGSDDCTCGENVA